MTTNPYTASDESDPVDRNLSSRQNRALEVIRNIVRLLWIAPLVFAIPAYFVVSEFIPDLNRASIGDGFRKLNVFLAVMGPLAILCWAFALLLTFLRDIKQIPKSRLWIWLTVFVMLIVLVMIVAAFDL